ncbi:MAG: type II toxin-antitoxin system VapC family toxin [bacterium]|nr:type II toxin-antitoxin system VapC family toxin [bacterium]
MTLVIDASVVVAGLLSSDTDGSWAEAVMDSDRLAAPHLMPTEVAHVLRRESLAGRLPAYEASVAYDQLLGLRTALFAHASVARRVWELRHNLSMYDACYVALAELLQIPLATLDHRLAQAAGPRCEILTLRA